jgi:hypothetical protein
MDIVALNAYGAYPIALGIEKQAGENFWSGRALVAQNGPSNVRRENGFCLLNAADQRRKLNQHSLAAILSVLNS